MASKSVGFTEGTWKGVPNYRCDYCEFAAAGATGLLRIKRHVAGHFMRGEATWADARVAKPAPERTVPDFASDEAAELAARYGDGVIGELLRREPSGRTGYTVADVRAAAAALDTLTEEEE